MKRYEEADREAVERMTAIRDKYHPELSAIRIGLLVVYDDEEDKQVLKHGGYAAAALARIVSERDRAAGMCDAQIILDQSSYRHMTDKQRDALLDHELHHFEIAQDKSGAPRMDTNERPKLKIRKHDHQFGWFDAIADRHGENSVEVKQARQLVEETGQLYFDFTAKAA